MSVIGDAVALLDPRPRGRRWSSLSYCVLDAVWSINTRYDSVVVPLVWRVAAVFGDDQPEVLEPRMDPVPLPALLARYADAEALQKDTNAQITSPHSGILRAEAALRYARILVDHEVGSLVAAQTLMAGSESDWKAVDRALAQVPGDGSYGIRRGYLWMLCGNDDLIKPDRMVLRWLSRFEPGIDPDRARHVVAEVATELTARLGRPVTPWMVDHAIWLDQRTR
ncbi:hypothetical protein [Actinoplanes xinjiangensis]|uniref:hypothetical protein n=1 Tax=Actinoplanes xinjiangensis TaxID=512350 RepID=UPI003422B343